MNDDEELAEAIGACLRQHVDTLPGTADPFAGFGRSLARDRRRRQATVAGTVAAVVGVAGGSLAGAGALGAGHHPSVTLGSPSPRTSGSASPSRTSPSPHWTDPTLKEPRPTGPLPWPTWTDGYVGWTSGWPLDFPHTGSVSAADAAVDQLVAAYGKPVDADSRAVVKELMMAFTSCGYPLDHYTFKLEWVGNMVHSGGKGGAVLTVTLGGTAYRMVAYNTYKGYLLEPVIRLSAGQAGHVDAFGMEEMDQPAEIYYSPIWADPGSRVEVTFHGQQFTDTVGASGLAEIKLISVLALNPVLGSSPGWPTQATITRPDGTTSVVTLGSDGEDNTPDTSRVLLPADSTCPGASFRE